MGSHKIVEYFTTYQGEGKHAGTAATFFRFANCNLDCQFGGGMSCDAAGAWKGSYEKMPNAEILAKAIEGGVPMVVFTGGEPSMEDRNDLFELLKRNNFYVAVETNGFRPSNIVYADWITYSPKGSFDNEAPIMQGGFNELKILGGVDNLPDPIKYASVKVKYLQPIGYEHEMNYDNFNACLQFIIENPTWKLSLQTQKWTKVD